MLRRLYTLYHGLSYPKKIWTNREDKRIWWETERKWTKMDVYKLVCDYGEDL